MTAACLAIAAAAFPHGFEQDIDLADLKTSDGVCYSGNYPNSFNGQVIGAAGDFNGDGFDDFIIGSPNTDVVNSLDGCAYVLFGRADGFSDLDLSIIDSDNSYGFKIYDSSYADSLGYSVAGIGDFNNDGCDDIIIGSWGNNAYVVFGKKTGVQNLDMQTFASSNVDGFKVIDAVFGDHTGFAVSGAGDVNGDGFDDVLIAADETEKVRRDEIGLVYVIFGKSTDISNIALATFTTSDQNGYRIYGSERQKLGRGVMPAGDMNDDGLADFIVSGWKYGHCRIDGQLTAQSVVSTIIYGKKDGYQDIDLSVATATDNRTYLSARHIAAGVGRPDFTSAPGVVGVDDFNGDGCSDVVVCCPEADFNNLTDSGSAYVVFGSRQTTLTISLNDLSEQHENGFRIDGSAEDQFLAGRISGAGDINHDGLSDLMLCAHAKYKSRNRCGSTYIIYGRSQTPPNLKLADSFTTGTDGFAIYGAVGNPLTDPIPSNAGDVNGDGIDDMLITQTQHEESNGATYLIFGKSDTPTSVRDWILY